MASSQKQEKIELPPIAGKLFWLREVDSTQLESRKLIDAGHRIPFVVLADCQTAGRGRFMRKWLSPPGGLYFSWATQFVPHPAVSLAAGIAVLSAIKKFCPGKIFLKWPNDILLANRKCGGILAEAEFSQGEARVIAGIGLNISTARQDFPAELRDRATSLQHHVSQPVVRGELLALLLTIYPVTRFLIEMIRDDEPAIWITGMTISQNVSLLVLFGAAGLWAYLLRRPAQKTWG